MKIHQLVVRRARQVKYFRDAEALPSPCISVCVLDEASGLCEGCLRTLDEIANWGMMECAQQRAVWAAIEQRAVDHADGDAPAAPAAPAAQDLP